MIINAWLKKLYIKLPILLYDITAIPLSWFLAYWLRFNLGEIDLWVLEAAVAPVFIILFAQVCAYYYFKIYRGVWYFSSVNDLTNIAKSVIAALVVSLPILYFSGLLASIPRSVIPLYLICLIGFLAGGRVLFRYLREKQTVGSSDNNICRVLIIGAGCAGERLLRDMQRQGTTQYKAVGFVDDMASKQGMTIHGVRVQGGIEAVTDLTLKLNVDMLFVAIPSLCSKRLRSIYKQCETLSIPVRTLPSLAEIASGQVAMNTLREVSINDLLGRDQIQLDKERLSGLVKGRRVLVTGGGGSIGSELCRQLAAFLPASLCVLDHSEYNLYQLGIELDELPLDNIRLALMSVTDRVAINKLMAEFEPELVFHAAAYKHVPMLEPQTRTAVKNNVVGTRIVAEAAVVNNVDKFILISTDKAVNPSNVMGATKRIAEIFCQHFNDSVNTQFITVRFGNVLGSAGSVVPLFKKQLQAGGPLTVTDPDITRYFMTIPEASQLILQSASQGEGGEIFVLDMGEPIKITYLAEQMIRLAGKSVGDDIEIVYTGLRPGEKLYEELFYKHEQLLKTPHSKIMKAQRLVDVKSKYVLERLQQASFDLDSIPALELAQLIESIRVVSPESSKHSAIESVVS